MAKQEILAKENKYMDAPVWNKRGNIKEGDELEGYLIERQEFTSKKYGDGVSYIIKKLDGTFVKVMGQTDIKAKLDQIEPGVHIWLTYKGLVETDRGSKKTYDVAADNEDVIKLDEE